MEKETIRYSKEIPLYKDVDVVVAGAGPAGIGAAGHCGCGPGCGLQEGDAGLCGPADAIRDREETHRRNIPAVGLSPFQLRRRVL